VAVKSTKSWKRLRGKEDLSKKEEQDGDHNGKQIKKGRQEGNEKRKTRDTGVKRSVPFFLFGCSWLRKVVQLLCR